MILVGVFYVAIGRGGELAYEQADHAPLDLGPVSATDVALLRPPTALWGYNMQVTDEALDRIARALRDRDILIASLQRQVGDTGHALGTSQAGQLTDPAGFGQTTIGLSAIGGLDETLAGAEATARNDGDTTEFGTAAATGATEAVDTSDATPAETTSVDLPALPAEKAERAEEAEPPRHFPKHGRPRKTPPAVSTPAGPETAEAPAADETSTVDQASNDTVNSPAATTPDRDQAAADAEEEGW